MKKKKIIYAFIISIILIISNLNETLANENIIDSNLSVYQTQDIVENYKIGDTQDGITDPRDNPGSYKPSDMTGTDKVMDIGNRIIGVIQVIGTFTSVIVLIVLGIKYMMGSIEEKAEYKKTMMPYLIGAILVFGITNILGIINSITDGLF